MTGGALWRLPSQLGRNLYICTTLQAAHVCALSVHDNEASFSARNVRRMRSPGARTSFVHDQTQTDVVRGLEKPGRPTCRMDGVWANPMHCVCLSIREWRDRSLTGHLNCRFGRS